jgi:N-acyl homoserine lactone hydrolase
VDTAILSHLHQDHIGGLAELTSSDLLVSAAEWAELSKPGPDQRGFLRRHIQLPGLRWHQVSPEPAGDPSLAPFTESLDVMGDGSLMLLPTPGHTAGSVSLLVRRGTRPPLLLAGDLTYGAELLQRGQLPGVGIRRQLAESTRKVLALQQQQPGLVLLPGPRPGSRPAAAGQLTPMAHISPVPVHYRVRWSGTCAHGKSTSRQLTALTTLRRSGQRPG